MSETFLISGIKNEAVFEEFNVVDGEGIEPPTN